MKMFTELCTKQRIVCLLQVSTEEGLAMRMESKNYN